MSCCGRDSRPFNKELKDAMEILEKDCRIVADKDTYITPDHIQVAEVPVWKRILWGFLEIILQPFRVMI